MNDTTNEDSDPEQKRVARLSCALCRFLHKRNSGYSCRRFDMHIIPHHIHDLHNCLGFEYGLGTSAEIDNTTRDQGEE